MFLLRYNANAYCYKIALALVTEGFSAAGYEYVIVDDGWMAPYRDNVTGKLVPDPTRFPSGIPALTNYVLIMSSIPYTIIF